MVTAKHLTHQFFSSPLLRVVVARGGVSGLVTASRCHAKGLWAVIFERAAPYVGSDSLSMASIESSDTVLEQELHIKQATALLGQYQFVDPVQVMNEYYQKNAPQSTKLQFRDYDWQDPVTNSIYWKSILTCLAHANQTYTSSLPLALLLKKFDSSTELVVLENTAKRLLGEYNIQEDAIFSKPNEEHARVLPLRC